MEHNWDKYFDTASAYWKDLQELYRVNDKYPKIVVSNRNLHHKFMRSFSKLEGTPIDNDNDNLMRNGENVYGITRSIDTSAGQRLPAAYCAVCPVGCMPRCYGWRHPRSDRRYGHFHFAALRL